MENTNDNCIEWINGDEMASATFSQRRFITVAEKLEKKYPDEVKIVTRNTDGSIVVHFPLYYLHINNASKNLTEEQRREKSELLRLGLSIKSLEDKE